jgi:hypothetical protein
VRASSQVDRAELQNLTSHSESRSINRDKNAKRYLHCEINRFGQAAEVRDGGGGRHAAAGWSVSVALLNLVYRSNLYKIMCRRLCKHRTLHEPTVQI